MKCPSVLGLFTRCKVSLILHANELRLMLPCDSEIDLVLVDCFTPPVVQWDETRGEAVQYEPGVAAYHATCEILTTAPNWLRAWIPVPKYDREWFRNLKPGTIQPGHLWISPTETLNQYLVRTGHATREQCRPGDARYDGAAIEPPAE